jgi:uncharacterized protein (TIGR03067 family)
MKQLWLVGVVVFLAFTTPAKCEDSKEAKDDEKAIQGTWLASSAELAGMPFAEPIVKTIRLVLTDGKYTVSVGPRVDEGTSKIDPSKKPKALDIVGTKGPNMGKTMLAIYELTGDTLRVCYDLSGKARPDEFKTKPGTQLFLATYHREKK